MGICPIRYRLFGFPICLGFEFYLNRTRITLSFVCSFFIFQMVLLPQKWTNCVIVLVSFFMYNFFEFQSIIPFSVYVFIQFLVYYVTCCVWKWMKDTWASPQSLHQKYFTIWFSSFSFNVMIPIEFAFVHHFHTVTVVGFSTLTWCGLQVNLVYICVSVCENTWTVNTCGYFWLILFSTHLIEFSFRRNTIRVNCLTFYVSVYVLVVLQTTTECDIYIYIPWTLYIYM